MRIGELTMRLGASLEEVISALYHLARTDQQKMILNSGCDHVELEAAEQRVGYALHPLHRFLLGISNGGTLPYNISIDRLAAAIPREATWNWTPPLASSASADEGAGPFPRLLLGESIADWYGRYILPKLHLESFIFLAAGYDGQCFGYARDTAGRIEMVNDEGRHTVAADFEVFIRRLSLNDDCDTTAFQERMQATLHMK